MVGVVGVMGFGDSGSSAAAASTDTEWAMGGDNGAGSAGLPSPDVVGRTMVGLKIPGVVAIGRLPPPEGERDRMEFANAAADTAAGGVVMVVMEVVVMPL